MKRTLLATLTMVLALVVAAGEKLVFSGTKEDWNVDMPMTQLSDKDKARAAAEEAGTGTANDVGQMLAIVTRTKRAS